MTADTKLRELADRMVAMAPEPPPYPETQLSEPVPVRRAGPVVLFAATAVVVIVLVGLIPLLFGGRGGDVVDDPVDTPVTPVTTTPPPREDPSGPAPGTEESWKAWTMVDLREDMGLHVGTGHILKAVAADENTVVAVGDARGQDDPDLPMRHAVIWVSSDGLDWERVVDPEDLETGGKSLEVVVAGGPGFIAGGNSCDPVEGEKINQAECFHPALFTSVDGRTWDRVPDDPSLFGDRGAIYHIAVRESDIIAMGAVCIDDHCGGMAWQSVDGLKWEQIWGVDESFWSSPMVETANGLVALDPFMFTSADGTDWVEHPFNEKVFGHDDPENLWAVTSITGGPNLLVAAGTDGTNSIIWTSVDGITWQRPSQDPKTFVDSTVQDVIPWGEGFIAIGPDFSLTPLGNSELAAATVSSPQFWFSPDGTQWHRLDFGNPEEIVAIRAVTEFQGALVAVGQSGQWDVADHAIWINQAPPAPTISSQEPES